MYKKFVDAKYPFSIYIKFALLLTLAYLPMVSLIMSLKNDALTLSYPQFRFFSEQVRQGYIPWWHSHVHMGFPLHADPGFPFWSPITWLWAALGSSLYTYTFLVYSYILIGGVGVLKLAGWLKFGQPTRLFVAIAFCVSGFFSAHLQHPHYIFEAAFVPFALLYFLRLIYAPNLRNTMFFAVSIFFLVNSGYPSFTISAIYFFFILLICIALSDKNINKQRSLIYLSAAVLTSILLCLPYLYSILQFLPFYNRGVPTITNYVDSGGMSVRSFLSVLFPLPSVTDPVFFQTDRSWSNISIGLLATIFAVYGFRYIKHPLKWPLTISGLCMLVASTHGTVKGLLYKIVPLFDFMHSNGGLRIYYVLIALIFAGFGMEHFLQTANTKWFKKITFVVLAIFISAGISSLLLLPSSDSYNGLREFLKNLSLKNAILIQSLLGIVTASALLLFLKHKRAIIIVGLAEVITVFLLNLPFTGLGLNSAAETQRRINAEARDFSTYPSGLKSYFLFKARHPEKHDIFSPVSDFKITGDRLSFNGFAHNNDTIVIPQNYYLNWKFFINYNETKPGVAYGTFIALPVAQGGFEVKAAYKPTGVVVCFVMSIFAWAGIGIALFKKNAGRTNVYRNN